MDESYDFDCNSSTSSDHQPVLFFTSFGRHNMRARSSPIAGFIVPYTCYEVKKTNDGGNGICLDRNRMKIRKGRLRLSPNEEAQIVKEQTEKLRKLRIQQVREQCKENAAKIRHAVKEEKHRQLMKLATDIKDQLDAEKAERVRHLEQQYDNSLRSIGVGHKHAKQQPDWTAERELVERAENLRADARGRAAMDKLRDDTAQQKQEDEKILVARQQALATERVRAAEIAALPPAPPDPLENVQLREIPVKMVDAHNFNFTTTHYHLQNDLAVDRAQPDEQTVNANEAAELEQERIQERALELKRLRHDQLERARLRHNVALEKELLKHDYNNILHDLSDLQRADWERRLNVVHSIPKQVFEPPNARMEDREVKQRHLEEEFENMYMKGTDKQGEISMALDPRDSRTAGTGAGTSVGTSQDTSLDVTATSAYTGTSPLQEPTLPGMPPVLRDMTNVPKPGKKPEKVLRNLMDRIKSQREEWVNSHSMLEVGESTLPGQPPMAYQQHMTHGFPNHQPGLNGDNDFHAMMPDNSPDSARAPSAMKHARVHSPVSMVPDRDPPLADLNDSLRSSSGKHQQTNLVIPPVPGQSTTVPPELQQAEFVQILRQQEDILEQKKQLELKLQQLTYEQHKMQLAGQASMVKGQVGPFNINPNCINEHPPLPVPPNPDPYAVNQGLPNTTGMGPHANVMPSQLINEMLSHGDGMLSHANIKPQNHALPTTAMSGVPGTAGVAMPTIVSGVTMATRENLIALATAHQQMGSSLSSSGMSQNPMNSIPPTHTTGTGPIMTSQGQGYPQGHMQGHPMSRSAYQPPSAVLTTEQLQAPMKLPTQLSSSAQPQPQPPMTQQTQPPKQVPVSLQNGYAPSSVATTFQPPIPQMSAHRPISPGHIPPTSLTNSGMNEQLRKVKEYQEYLLHRHEQSKQVLENTKAEITRRRQSLLQRYPNLDLTRLEDLGAKYLQPGAGGPSQQPLPQSTVPSSQQQQTAVPMSVPQDPGSQQSVLVQDGDRTSMASLLASLASHPYYASTLSQPEVAAALSSAQTSSMPQHAAMNTDANLRKNNKFEAIRKSLPFDGDITLQSSPDRVFDAYAQRNQLDMTDTTDVTETDTSSLTERGSPALKPAAPKPAPRNLVTHQEPGPSLRSSEYNLLEQSGTSLDESGLDTTAMDTTASGSYLSDDPVRLTADPATIRQEELKKQLAEIQQQKEDIIRRHQQGQQKLQSKEEELRARLATMAPEHIAQQLRASVAEQQALQALEDAQTDGRTDGQTDALASLRHGFNLSTIHEVETPVTSSRPSDHSQGQGHTSRPSSQGQGHSVIQEEIDSSPEQGTSKNTARGPTVADYSGKNIDDVLERAKRFETEVVEKLRKQTNRVLFDNEFDDSLEFSVSRRQQSSIPEPLSTGSITDDSLSTGPLDDTNPSPSRQHQDISKSTANGSFQTSNSWATELNQYKMPASNQVDLPFKLIPSMDDSRTIAARISFNAEKDTSKASTKDTGRSNKNQEEDDEHLSRFTSNRFQVYSTINDSADADVSAGTSFGTETGTDSMDAGAMMKHLQQLQAQLRKGEVERRILAQKLSEQQQTSGSDPSPGARYSWDSDHSVSRPFMPEENSGNFSELSQHSLTDASTTADQSNRLLQQSGSHDHSPDQSGARRELPPVRRSPIGHSAKGEVEPRTISANGGRDVTSTDEYSFLMNDSKDKRTTSTPGDDKKKSQRPAVAPGYQFNTFVPEQGIIDVYADVSETTTEELSQFSIQSENSEFADESKTSNKPLPKVKTFAVSRDGDLISENSDSDKSLGVTKNSESLTTAMDLTNYSLSQQGSSADPTLSTQETNSRLTGYSLTPSMTTRDTTDSSLATQETTASGLSAYSLPDSSTENRLSQISEFSNKNSSESESAKSSSLTNVTSDTSANITGVSVSNLSQHTLNDTRLNQTADESRNNINDKNYIAERFAGLDNLISESKHLIARHKQVIEKTKFESEKPVTSGSLPSDKPLADKKVEQTCFERKEAVIEKGTNKAAPVLPNYPPPPPPMESDSADDISRSPVSFDTRPAAENSRLSSIDNSKTGSLSLATMETTDNQSATNDESSLDYMLEHSSGITEETLPDITTMTVESEISFADRFQKTEDLSESSDSLKSFENHEMSDSDAAAAGHTLDRDMSKSPNIQRIVEARKHNFMVQSEQRAVAAKERALAQVSSGKPDEAPVFRAVPVNVVATPKLSVSVSTNASNLDRGRSPTRSSGSTGFQGKGAKSVNDKKKSFEAKEKEIKASISPSKPLNKALLPRDYKSPTRPKDSGTKPSEAKSRDTTPTFAKIGNKPVTDTANNRGRLFGEIKQFGGQGGLSQKQSPSPPMVRKTPPKVLPKPVRQKTSEGPAPSAAASKPLSAAGAITKPASGLSKTLSSWKKSRAVTAPSSTSRAEPSSHEALKSSVQVLPTEAPAPLSEEERKKRAEDELYEKNIRAYNPRLFRLQHKLDRADTTNTSEPGSPSSADRSRDSKKDSVGNLRSSRK